MISGGRIGIAIDGPAGAGKSTTARLLAHRLGYIYIDTGAMYRAVTLKAQRTGIALDAQEELACLARGTSLRFLVSETDENGFPLGRLEMDGEDVSESIRTAEVTHGVSPVSAVPGVREAMVRQQQVMARRGGVVMDGRDIGTVVMPEAELKIYLVADVEERIRRRCLENKTKGLFSTEEDIRRQIVERDYQDSHRAHSPLKPAADAVILDTTDIPVEGVVARIMALAKERGALVPE